MLKDFVERFSQFESIDPGSVKARFYESEHFALGEGAGDAYIHLSIWVLEGRSPELLEQISRGMNQLLHTMLSSREKAQHISVTLEVRQMEKANYFKSQLK